MEKFEKHLINWLIIGFFLIIDIALIPLMFIYFWPEQASYIGDIFAWTGAIIGGTLTLFGVRLTIKSQDDLIKRERFLDTFNTKLRVVEATLENIKFIIEPEIVLLNFADIRIEGNKHVLDKKLEYLSKFEVEVKNHIDNIKLNTDFGFYKKIDTLFKSFLRIDFDLKKVGDAIEKKEEVYRLYYNKALSIYKSLEDYKNSLIEKYHELK